MENRRIQLSTTSLAIDLDACMPLMREEMHVALAPDGGQPHAFYGSMRYAVGLADEQLQPVEVGGGKLLRPRLVLLSCVAAGGDLAMAIPVAAAVELLHNFTLVHDDIQDNSPQRRHHPSLWNLIGMPLAINAGDAMYASAHLVLSSLARRGRDPELVLHALEEFDQTAITLCEGQHMDISFEMREVVSTDEYLAMIERKTGALMGLSCYLGALVAGAPSEALRAYRRFGLAAGMSYQVHDDLAGVWQEESRTGKREMEDIYGRKKSFPAMRLFETASREERDRQLAIYRGSVVDEQDALWVRDLMTRLGLHEEGRSRVERFAAEALVALSESGASGAAADHLYSFAQGKPW